MTKAELFAKAKRRYTEVDGVRIQSLTELEKINVRGLWSKRAKELPKDDKVAESEHVDRMNAELLVLTLVDESGNRLFADNEISEVQTLDSVMFDTLADAAYEHCFPRKGKPVEANEKKSEDPADSK
jgi:hypothetical protein